MVPRSRFICREYEESDAAGAEAGAPDGAGPPAGPPAEARPSEERWAGSPGECCSLRAPRTPGDPA